jgi:hypothetical protein
MPSTPDVPVLLAAAVPLEPLAPPAPAVPNVTPAELAAWETTAPLIVGAVPA